MIYHNLWKNGGGLETTAHEIRTVALQRMGLNWKENRGRCVMCYFNSRIQ